MDPTSFLPRDYAYAGSTLFGFYSAAAGQPIGAYVAVGISVAIFAISRYLDMTREAKFKELQSQSAAIDKGVETRTAEYRTVLDLERGENIALRIGAREKDQEIARLTVENATVKAMACPFAQGVALCHGRSEPPYDPRHLEEAERE